MTTTLLPVPRPSRLRPWARVLLWATALTAALLAASVLYVAAALSGGLDDLLDLSSPAPTDARVVASQRQSLQDLRALPLPVDGTPLARGEGSGCVQGEHTWKRDDAYDLACAASVSVVVPQRGLRPSALALHERLLADGWAPTGLALDGVVAEHVDARPGVSAADLPPAGYVRDGVALQVDWLADGRGRVAPWHVDRLVWSPAPPVVPGLAVALTLTEEHFRE